tara:strand:+ start:542 stop:1162 length:621 start_codon:yes stop_codon:yes gene_type:complete
MKLTDAYEETRQTTIAINETGKKGVRSPKRTDTLNDCMIQWLDKNTDDSWTFNSEISIDCARGGSFKIDVVGYKGGKMKSLFLLKAIESSYNKNRHNYGNTVAGEASRVFDLKARRDLDVFFIDWIPRKLPIYNKDGKKLKDEKTKALNLQPAEDRWNTLLEERNSSISFLKIDFDFDFKKNKVDNYHNDKLIKDTILEKINGRTL